MSMSATAPDFQAFFDLTPVPLVVMAADEKFTILAANEQYLHTTMTRRDDIVGLGMFEVFPDNPSFPSDPGATELRHSLEHVVKTGKPHTLALIKYDIRTANGSFEERYWSAKHSPVPGDDGKVMYILQHTEDVTPLVKQSQRAADFNNAHEQLEMKTARMEAEILRRVQELEAAYAQVEESEHKLRQVASEASTWKSRYSAAIEASGQIMYDWNPVTNELLFAGNVKNILGFEIDEIAGPLERWLSIVHPDDVDAFNGEIRRVLDERVPFRLTFRVIRKDGKVIYCEDHGNFFRDSQDNVLRMVGFVRDVTKRIQTENDLLESQARLSMAQKAGRIGAFEWIVPENRIVWTPELEQLYGLEPGAFKGDLGDWAAHVLPEDAEEITREIEQRIRDKVQDYYYEFRVVEQALQKKEQALQKKEQALQLAVAIAQMGMFEIDLQNDEVSINSIGRNIYGWQDDTPLTFQFVQSHFHPEDREAIIADVTASFSPASSGEFSVEHRIVTVTGETRWIRVRGQTIFESIGGETAAVRSVGTYLDITREKEFEHVLRESEEKFRTMADNISHLAWMTDSSGRRVWYNRRFLEYTGVTAEQMLAGHRVIPSEIYGRVMEKFTRHIAAGTPWEDTYPIRSASGEYRWFLSRATPIHDETGKIIRWFGTNTDVTDQMAAEQRLREREERLAELNLQLEAARDDALAASEAKSTFLAIMSHELRTPLNAVIGYAEMLRDEALSGHTDPVQIATDLDRIAISGQHLLVLISDILDFSKIEAGGMELVDEDIELDVLVKEAVSAVAPQCQSHGNILTVTPAVSGQQVRGDYLRIKQVLINLLGNAAKFTENGSIEIKYGFNGCEDGRAGMYFEITDTGIGISEASMPYLYEKFRQVDSSHTRRHGGTGLGLAISKRLVDLMKGTIEATSRVGHGTTFKVCFPRRPADQADPALPAGELS